MENDENDLLLKDLQFLHENKDTGPVFDFTAQVERKMDRNLVVIHHTNDNYDTNNFPAGKTYISQSCQNFIIIYMFFDEEND